MAKELPVVPRYVLNRYRVPDKYLPKDEERIMERPWSPEEIRSLADSVSVWQPNITL
jgi:pyruvate formate lyase activating enzyme